MHRFITSSARMRDHFAPRESKGSFLAGKRNLNCAILMFSPGYYKRLGDLDHSRSGIQPTSQRYCVQRILSAMQQLGDRFRPFLAVHSKK
mmetsp:Transcript_56383/g.117843  ORF Transcript_56383/g.117843 Transcript_56383/m.117843 type:complete len:90 (+) Transcript_56383:505-774(+)